MLLKNTAFFASFLVVLSLLFLVDRGVCVEIPVNDGHVTFQISGVLQPDDSQFVHDVLCAETGGVIGTVRMRWGFKYGSRYGGVGVATEGNIERVWNGDGGWVKVKIGPDTPCDTIVVRQRLAKIPD